MENIDKKIDKINEEIASLKEQLEQKRSEKYNLDEEKYKDYIGKCFNHKETYFKITGLIDERPFFNCIHFVNGKDLYYRTDDEMHMWEHYKEITEDEFNKNLNLFIEKLTEQHNLTFNNNV